MRADLGTRGKTDDSFNKQISPTTAAKVSSGLGRNAEKIHEGGK